MCGNASRCIGKYLYERGLTEQTEIRLLTLSGIKILRLHLTDGTVENMLKGHAAMSSMNVTTDNGQVAVGLSVDENGVVIAPVTPANWNVG